VRRPLSFSYEELGYYEKKKLPYSLSCGRTGGSFLMRKNSRNEGKQE
jgi:hypothetical protein